MQTSSARTDAIERTLRASNLFSGVEQGVSDFARVAIRKQFHHGEYIWHHGDAALALTIITNGLVKICQPNQAGESAIVALFGPRESIGDIAVISSCKYPADAIAVTRDVEVLMIEKKPVLEAMQRDLALANAINRSLVSHSAALRQKIRIMTAGPVERRLAALLLHLAERFGDENDQGEIEIPVALSRADLARLVGATIETTIRAMSRWQKSGLVSTTPQGFVIHRPKEIDADARPA
jgi:CRP-like cAMP-binding protein